MGGRLLYTLLPPNLIFLEGPALCGHNWLIVALCLTCMFFTTFGLENILTGLGLFGNKTRLLIYIYIYILYL